MGWAKAEIVGEPAGHLQTSPPYAADREKKEEAIGASSFSPWRGKGDVNARSSRAAPVQQAT